MALYHWLAEVPGQVARIQKIFVFTVRGDNSYEGKVMLYDEKSRKTRELYDEQLNWRDNYTVIVKKDLYIF